MARIETTPAGLQEHLRRLLIRRQVQAQRAARDTAQRGLYYALKLTNQKKLNDTGAYRRGFKVRGTTLINDAPHAGFIEHGKGPGTPGPPIAPILAWVRRKLRLPPSEALNAARRIAAAIHYRGLPPHKIMFHTYQKMRKWIQQEYEKRLRRS